MENITTKEEALKAIEKLNQFIKDLDNRESKEILMEKRFLELMNQGLVLKIEKGEINYYNGNYKLIVSIELNNKEVWFLYSIFWSKFESEFHLNEQQVKKFLNTMVEKHLNCNNFTTY